MKERKEVTFRTGYLRGTGGEERAGRQREQSGYALFRRCQ